MHGGLGSLDHLSSAALRPILTQLRAWATSTSPLSATCSGSRVWVAPRYTRAGHSFLCLLAVVARPYIALSRQRVVPAAVFRTHKSEPKCFAH